ncbi:MAG TPA: AI-2E family transporter [Egibacteraceae bacterium]|nr:AI-2E family transporter [Egibacteraceae bacterium]
MRLRRVLRRAWPPAREGASRPEPAESPRAPAASRRPPDPQPDEDALPAATPSDREPEPIWRHPLVRAGAYAWAVIGLVFVLRGVGQVMDQLRVIVVPLILALFPAALLSPVMRWLVGRRVPPAVAALLVIVGSIGLMAGGVRLLAPAIAAEIPGLTASIQAGIVQLEEFLEAGPFGVDPAMVTDLLDTGREQLIALGQQAVGTVAAAVAEGLAGLLFGLVALFFYLKDGARIAAWLNQLFPDGMRQDAEAIGTRAWLTIGAYFRGQLLVALVDAVFIGLGLALLRVPLALPLAVLVFVGGLFPIVGAFVSGTVAVLVALADGGLAIALAVLAIVVAVQQIESNVLAPLVLGKATALHPLAVILALAAGGIVQGVLGAFLAVPVAASLARAVGHLRRRKQHVEAPPVSRAASASAAGR